MKRRKFFEFVMTGIASLLFVPLISKKGSLAYADNPILRDDDPVAKKLGYHYDSGDVDPLKWKKKAGPGGDNQRCATCSLYSPLDGNHGNCDLVAKNTVNWNGWCNSWKPIAKVKTKAKAKVKSGV